MSDPTEISPETLHGELHYSHKSLSGRVLRFTMPFTGTREDAIRGLIESYRSELTPLVSIDGKDIEAYEEFVTV